MRKTETQVNENRCPVTNKPAEYTEEARRLDQANKDMDRKIECIEKRIECGDKCAHEKREQIRELESEATKAAKEFNKEQDKNAKSELTQRFFTIIIHQF